MKNICRYTVLLFVSACTAGDDEKQTETPNPNFDIAYEYVDAGKPDSSFFFFDKARQVFLENNDNFGAGKCLVNMAITQKDQGDYFGAQETALQATDYLDKSNPEHHIYLSTNYNNLGAATVKLSDFGQALTFYELALQFSSDSLNTLVYQNNIAICYQQLKEYDQALQIYTRIHNEIKYSRTEYARVLSNLARTKWLADPVILP